MQYLTIIRHAKSSWENPELDDFDRPLNERGKKAILLIGNFLKENNVQPDFILSSSAKRARKTAEGIATTLNYPTNCNLYKHDIYSGDLKQILNVISEIDHYYNDVFLFGHEPILSQLIFHFTKISLEKFPTCAVFRIAFDINHWTETNSKIGKCEFFVKTKELINK